MIEDIYSFGPLNVVLVVTDTCNTMKKCWDIIQDEFPWMNILPCQAHVVSLLLKDIGNVDNVQTVIKDENTVINWFSNHQLPLAILRRKVKEALGTTKELVRAATTRFGTNTLVGERLLELQPALQATIVDKEYVAQKYKDEADVTEEGDGASQVRQNKGGTTKRLCLDDAFWDRIRQHVQVSSPIMKLLRRHDTSAPTVGKVYSGWFEVGEGLKAATAPYAHRALESHEKRWAYGHSSFAAAAYVLDPEFHSHEQSKNEEVMEGFLDVVEKLSILVKVRQLHATDPKKYQVQWEKRSCLIVADPIKQQTYEDYPLYPTCEDPEVKEFLKAVNAQLIMYKTKKGIFARSWVLEAAETMPAYLWWQQYGASTPELQTVACFVLAQPASASIIERINSEFAFVKDKKRNRLVHTKANKLVGLFHNLRLLKRMKNPKYSEPAVSWGEEESKSHITKYGVAHYA